MDFTGRFTTTWEMIHFYTSAVTLRGRSGRLMFNAGRAQRWGQAHGRGRGCGIGPATAPQPLDPHGENSKKGQKAGETERCPRPAIPIRRGFPCAWGVPRAKGSGAFPLICGRRLQSPARTALCVSVYLCKICTVDPRVCVTRGCVRRSEPETLPRCIPAW